jgi:hypothetical protein
MEKSKCYNFWFWVQFPQKNVFFVFIINFIKFIYSMKILIQKWISIRIRNPKSNSNLDFGFPVQNTNTNQISLKKIKYKLYGKALYQKIITKAPSLLSPSLSSHNMVVLAVRIMGFFALKIFGGLVL